MPDRGLTNGEARVLKAYVEYEKHETAAQALGISTQTLKNHLGSIYKKLNVKKAHSAVYKLALEEGIDIFRNVEPENAGTNSQNEA